MLTIKLQDNPLRIYLNYAHLASAFYEAHPDPMISTQYIDNVLKRQDSATNKLVSSSFKHLLKYKNAIPHLVSFLKLDGVFGYGFESTFGPVVRSRSEKVKVTYFIYIRC
jgi:hypothetical protein